MGPIKTIDPNGDVVLVLNTTSNDTATQPKQGSETPADKSKELRLVVSSKQLMLASPVFMKMLSNTNFKEGKTLQDEGKVEIPLPDDDAEAFQIILDIVHGQTSMLARHTSLDLLCKIAILVDKYEMSEPTRFFAEIWTSKLLIPTGYNDSLYTWLFVAWVFDMDVQFRLITRILIRESYHDTHIRSSLPTPSRIYDAIQTSRQAAIVSIYSVVQDKMSLYQKAGKIPICQPYTTAADAAHQAGCDAMVLGSLLIGATELGLYPVVTSGTFPSQSVLGAQRQLSWLSVRTLCDEKQAMHPPSRGGFGPTPQYQPKFHGIPEGFRIAAAFVYDYVGGLELRDYKDNMRSSPPDLVKSATPVLSADTSSTSIVGYIDDWSD